ncbi:hypothetical protein GPECTOR_56g398 [Gonium pectorale]|uniref:Uncharacterized protein n=1 Tax=Gonium pectorale TaxID=33097 RepID=A0A150G624_GONPE|nr:hypothetical protein GPECTOR_56g398 [Gonium pectorale]|eukprot:KXZ45302.1 hypothetical protein GPECTOR_56g398 [Gonium pectorale]
MEKLGEYLQKHPARTAKVSRRLTRRIKQELYSKRYGFVKVAVYTYKYLLAKTADEDSKFTFTYFAKELIDEPDAVIRTLLSHPEPLIKSLGADLLASYIKAQNPVDHQMRAVAPLVSAACELARRGGSAQQQLTIASLRAVAAFLGLCHDLKTLPANLEEIEAAVLHNLDPSGASKGTAPDELTSHGLAHGVLLQFKPFLQAGRQGMGGWQTSWDISTVYRVMETLFRYLDQDGRWQQAETVQRLMDIVQSSCSDQPFPLFTALMRHSSAPGLRPDERVVVINLALQQPPVYSLSAFSVALQELPRALTADRTSVTDKLASTVGAAIRKLAQEVGDAAQLCEAISSVLRQHATPSKQAQACLQCVLTAVHVLPTFPESGRTFPGGHAPAQLLQQLAAIITVWGPAEADSRAIACELMLAVLAACGPGLRDEKQALGLMDMVLQMAGNVSLGTPADVATMGRVLAACLASRKPELLLHGVRLARVLLAEALTYTPLAGAAAVVERAASRAAGIERPGTGNEEADRLWGVALLMLVNNLLSTLAARANCSHLLPLRFSIPPDACTSLKEENGSLVSCSLLFEGNPRSVEACLRTVHAEWPVEHWYGKVLDALCKGSLLQTHYMHSLQNVVFEPFAAHAMPGLPATQHLAAAQPAAAAAAAGASSDGTFVGGTAARSGRDNAIAHISSKLEAMARSRVASIKRERLNLQHVMDMLTDGEADEASDAGGRAAAAPTAGGSASAPGAPASAAAIPTPAAVSADDVALTVDDVLDVVAALDQLPQPAARGPGTLEMADLVQRLEAITG